jgi:hypothetical protein
MNAGPLLADIARALWKSKLETVLVGNAGAALHGAPVTTLDFDFLFRPVPQNLAKMKVIARELGGIIYRPFYPASDLYRLINDERMLQIDFMTKMSAIRSLASLKSRSIAVTFGIYTVHVASLADIIKSKRAAGREKDKAVLKILEATLAHQK